MMSAAEATRGRTVESQLSAVVIWSTHPPVHGPEYDPSILTCRTQPRTSRERLEVRQREEGIGEETVPCLPGCQKCNKHDSLPNVFRPWANPCVVRQHGGYGYA